MFHNAKAATPTQVTLEELGHKQPPTPLQTDNTTALGISNKTSKHQQSKAMDVRFFWLGDQ